MSVNVNDKSGLVESFTPGYEGCGCGNRRYYTKAEIDEMFRNVLDPEQIEKIVKEVVDEYVTSEEFSQVIISIIGEDYYTKAQIDTILEGYATKAWTTGDTDSRISTAMASETARTEDVYAKKTDVPSLDGYATTGWVDSQNYLKDITLTINGTELHNNGSIIIEGGGGEPIDLSDYAKTTAVTEAIETAIASETARTESTYAKPSQIPSLTGYATENYVDAAITAATENLPSKNWVIGHTDLAMATETGRTESTYAKKTDLDGKVDTSAFTTFTAYTEDCCENVNEELRYLTNYIIYLQQQIDEMKGETGSTGSTEYIELTFNVLSTTEPAWIAENSKYPHYDKMIIDNGPEIDFNCRYTFSTTGIHNVKLRLIHPDNMNRGNEIVLAGSEHTGFTNCYLISWKIPDTIESMCLHMQKRNDMVESITLLPTTPPILIDTYNDNYAWCFNDISTIYVPAESLNAYKTATGWSKVANRIVAIHNN